MIVCHEDETLISNAFVKIMSFLFFSSSQYMTRRILLGNVSLGCSPFIYPIASESTPDFGLNRLVHFMEFAFMHPKNKFFVTQIGCSIAAFTPDEIAPLFAEALDWNHVILPKDFVEVIQRIKSRKSIYQEKADRTRD